MSLTLSTAMEISPSVVKSENATELPKKVTNCSSNHGNYFGNAGIMASEEKVVLNCQDNVLHMEKNPESHDYAMASGGNDEDVEVNIVEDVNLDEERLVERDLQDVTESSSSFGCTNSGTENAENSTDVEVESQMREDNASFLEFDGFNGLSGTSLRKKKLSVEWRRFLLPVMWRCKWAELRYRELRSQASKYEKELAECHRRKQTELENHASEDLSMKSAPLNGHYQPLKLMKRRRRKRVEETTDLASYTSSHDLLSYYAKRRFLAGFVSVDDDDDDVEAETARIDGDVFGVKCGLPTLDSQNDDTFESILRKMEEVQSQIQELRARMDNVFTEFAGKFIPDDSSFVPYDQPVNCEPDIISPNLNGESLGMISEKETGKKLFVREDVICNNGEGIPFHDMLKDIGYLNTYDDMDDEILIYNQPLKQEYYDIEEFGVQRLATQELARQAKVQNTQDLNPSSPSGADPREQQSGKVRGNLKVNSPKNKRKRTRRKARVGRWNRRSSG